MKKALFLCIGLFVSPSFAITTLLCEISGTDAGKKIKDTVVVEIEEKPLYISIEGKKETTFQATEVKNKNKHNFFAHNSSTPEKWEIFESYEGINLKTKEKYNTYTEIEINRLTGSIRIQDKFNNLERFFTGKCKKEDKLKF